MDHRTISSMTVSRIKDELALLEELPAAVRDALTRDKRATVRKLAEQPKPPRRRPVPERDMLEHERPLWEEGLANIAGVDEAGRGPLAGPVFAAAVILPPHCELPGLTDSKKLTAAQREALAPQIEKAAVAAAVAMVDVEVIDTTNIFQASMKAMRMALAALEAEPDHVLVDGPFTPGSPFPETAVVKGDAASLSIAAASVLAKVGRDRLMVEMDQRYPGYGFAKHKGYGTPQHLAALKERGPCPIHRKSFFGVMETARNRSEGYEHMARGIKVSSTEQELAAVGRAIGDQVGDISSEERNVLRKLYCRKRAQLRRESR